MPTPRPIIAAIAVAKSGTLVSVASRPMSVALIARPNSAAMIGRPAATTDPNVRTRIIVAANRPISSAFRVTGELDAQPVAGRRLGQGDQLDRGGRGDLGRAAAQLQRGDGDVAPGGDRSQAGITQRVEHAGDSGEPASVAQKALHALSRGRRADVAARLPDDVDRVGRAVPEALLEQRGRP
jgi:hypothetical protein